MDARKAATRTGLAGVGLGTSALMSNPDPYPRVFWPPNVTPRSVRILSHRSPGTVGQIPMGHEYPQVWSGEFVDV